MARLSALQPEDIRSVEIPVADETLHIKVDASVMTIGWQKRLNRAGAEEDINAFATEFFRLVKEWDLEDDDGEILPLETETVELLSVATFIRLVEAIGDKLNPNSVTPRKSRKS